MRPNPPTNHKPDVQLFTFSNLPIYCVDTETETEFIRSLVIAQNPRRANDLAGTGEVTLLAKHSELHSEHLLSTASKPKATIPYQKGDRILCLHNNTEGTVTKVHFEGFDWQLDHSVNLLPREGMSYQKGTTYEAGFPNYKNLSR
jgi:hypothetical protein